MEREEYWLIEKKEEPHGWAPLTAGGRYGEKAARDQIAAAREREATLREHYPKLRQTTYRLVKVTREVVEESTETAGERPTGEI